jgi:acetoin utilization deacetylase AcuC-like enzyme
MNKTGFVRHPLYLKHIIDRYIRRVPDPVDFGFTIWSSRFRHPLVIHRAREATKEELGWIHQQYYIDRVAATEGEYVRLDPDTGTLPETYRAALDAAGGLLSALDAIYRGEVDNAFAAVRPPGHHAEANRSSGFCLFNNVAIAAEYARRKLGAQRILIYDWDLHHGNGTQHSFESNPDVLYISPINTYFPRHRQFQ